MDDLKVWERIDDPNMTIDQKLAEVEDVLKHIDEKTPKGVWSREVEVKGCWLDVQESLETLKAMGGKDYLEVNYGTDEDPMIGRISKNEELDRIIYKLETYYGTHSIQEAIEKEYAEPGTKAQEKNKGIDR